MLCNITCFAGSLFLKAVPCELGVIPTKSFCQYNLSYATETSALFITTCVILLT